MNLFVRGLLALGVSAAVALTAAAAENTTPRLLPSKSTPAAPAAAPATVTAGGCATCADGSAHRVLKGRFFKRGGDGAAGFGANGNLSASASGLGAKAERVAEAYIGLNEKLGQCFQKLAGPPVDPGTGGSGGFGKHKGGPYTQPGTVVFPQHPFIRSPRDFFMMENP